MNQQQATLHIEGNCVSYTVKRSKKRRRTLSMVMHPQQGIVVSVPWRTSDTELHEFIHGHQRWLLTSVEQLKALPRYSFTTGEELSYLGEPCYLQITESFIAPVGCVHSPGELSVTIRPQTDKSARSMSVYKVLKAWYMQQAYLLLPARLLFWQERLGLVYNKLKITDPKQQWGCCDTQNNIRINWRIMLTGWDLIDYLLVHELCHVRHKNHSARYWKLVTSVLPNCSALRRSLRAHPAAYLHPPRPVEESFTSPSPLVSSLNDHTMFAVLG